MKNYKTTEQQITMNGVPVLLFTPETKVKKIPTILFYHGWGSNKEAQRFRGFILATLGFQVIIPDAIYHGDRNPIDHEKKGNSEKYFWKVIINNIDESDGILKEAIENYNADKDHIGVAGHSMGGFTASGIFTRSEQIKALTVINGSCAWNHTNHIFAQFLDLSYSPKDFEEEKVINELDPMNHLTKLIDRPILLLHGDKDSMVPIQSQRLFYEELKPFYKKEEKLKLVEYPRLNHYLTTNMMEEMYYFFKEYLIVKG